MPTPASLESDFTALREVIARHWGYAELRPLQEQALRAALTGQDFLLVLPTGGGKSLCYQAPPVLRGDTTLVVSPLIALMKDQVDALRQCGIAATQIDSSQTERDRFIAATDVRNGAVRLLFVSPERLVASEFRRMLGAVRVGAIAIDEAHCISHWGHDFRPEYRQLRHLKEWFPHAPIQAFTATATARVRDDICRQLGIPSAQVLVGDFDRPNLTYRVLPRYDTLKQTLEVLERHAGEAGIVYCFRRRDVDGLAAQLKERGFRVEPYHAGLSPEVRQQTQEAFKAETCDIVVATIAFGMGIDRSNVRFIVHAAMPKSMEHYQQETGRAGRDGLEAECVLLHSGADAVALKSIIQKSAAEADAAPEYLQAALHQVDEMDRYCRSAICRHRALVEYFGQTYPAATCSACDHCLGDVTPVADSLVVAQKILSAVARTKERFGVSHLAAVLRGEANAAVRQHRHDTLSVFGLLRHVPGPVIRDWLHQLASQEMLAWETLTLPSGMAVQIPKLNATSWEVMRGQRRDVRLVQLIQSAPQRAPRRAGADTAKWEGVDRPLFEALRGLRQRLAAERGVPPYIVFNDATLRAVAAQRPTTLAALRKIVGIGEVKQRDYGESVLEVVRDHCALHGIAAEPAPAPPASENTTRAQAFAAFAAGESVPEIARRLGRAVATIWSYLEAYVAEKGPDLAPWVPREVEARVRSAHRQLGSGPLRPLYLHLNSEVPYEVLRVVLAKVKILESRG